MSATATRLRDNCFVARALRKLDIRLFASCFAIPLTLGMNPASAQSVKVFDAFPSAPASARTPRPVAETFFGVTVNKLGVHKSWPGLGTSVVRLWDTHTRWMDIEPAKGEWDFARADMYVAYAEQHGAEILFTLGQTPAWGAVNPNAQCFYGVGCSPPVDLDDWRMYVRALAARYGSRVRYWELWNEPDVPRFWRGSAEQLAQMARIAREELHRVNPNAELIAPTVTGRGASFLDAFLKAGGGDSIDAISFHAYPNASLKQMMNIIKRVKRVAASHGRNSLPIWNTEFGVSCGERTEFCNKNGGMDSGSAIQRVVASLFVMAAENVENAGYYFWERNPPHAPFGLAAPPDFSSLTPAGKMYSAAVALLDGAVVTESFKDNQLLVVKFSNRGNNYIALWNEGGPRLLLPPRDWNFERYRMLSGGRLRLTQGGYLRLPASILVVGS